MARNPRKEAAVALEQALGYTFKDRDLFERALTHSSVGEGARAVRHYERLEFLGDRVLNLLAAERLLALDPDAREGELTPKHAALVNGKACARVARKMGLGEALKLGLSESTGGGRNKDSILGDACEALVAAIYIDGGFEEARAVFLKFWEDEINSIDTDEVRDAKTQLQVWTMARGLGLPEYELLAQRGPAHAPHFTVAVKVQGFEPEAGEGSSKRAAEKAAALRMLTKREGKA